MPHALAHDRLPPAGVGAPVDVQNLPAHELRGVQIEHGSTDLLHGPKALRGTEPAKEGVALPRMHRSVDRPGRDGVDPDVLRRVLDRQCPGRRLDSAL